MKILIYLTILLLPLSSFAAETGKYKVEGKTFDLIIKDPLVKDVYENCFNNKDANKKLSVTVADCTWRDLDTEKQSKVLKKYFNNDKNSAKYQSITIANVNSKSSSAVKKLEEYMYTKLQKALYGDISKAKTGSNKIQVVDHEIFNKLFQNQVSKNIISSISSYCIKAEKNDEGLYLISSTPETSQARQKKNIKNISVIATVTSKETKQDEVTSEAYSDWSSCLGGMTSVCSIKNPTGDEIHSKTEACIITDYIKSLKQSLIASKAIEKNYQGLNKAGFAVSNVEYFNPNDKGNSVDDLTSITSNEFKNESGYADEVAAEQKQLEKCVKDQSLAECKVKLGDTENREALDKAIVDYELRTRLIASKLESMGDAELRQHLEDEGRKDAEIQLLLENDDNRMKLRAEIKETYAAEQAAIISSLRKKIEGNTLTEKTKDAEVKTKYEIMQKELQYQTEDYTQLVQYTNLVSGFLNVVDDSGKKTTNLKSIERELANSAYDPKNAQDNSRSTASASPVGVGDSFAELTKKLDQMVKDKDGGDTGSSGPVGVKDINQELLRYRTVPIKKKKTE